MTEPDAQSAKTSTPAVSNEKAVPRRYWWLRRLLPLWALLAVGLPLMHQAWTDHLRQRFATETDRLQALGERVWVAEFQQPELPARDTAWTYYTHVFDAGWTLPHGITDMAEMARCWTAWNGGVNGYDNFRELFAEFINSHEDHLCLIRSGSHCPVSAVPGQRLQSPVLLTMTSPNQSGLRELARATATAAYFYAMDGNIDESIALIADGLAIARHSYAGPSMIDQLIGLAAESVNIQCVQAVLRQLEPSDRNAAKALLNTLGDDSHLLDALLRGLQFERATLLDTYQAIKTGQLPLNLGWNTRSQIAVQLAFPVLQHDWLFAARTVSAACQLVRAGQFQRARETLASFHRPAHGLAGLAATHSRLLVPALGRSVELFHRGLAERRMTMVAIAMRLYELDHGRRPDSLNDLVPHYLPKLPADPFCARGQTFGYLPRGRGARLYSLGIDGKDDAGVYELHTGGWVDNNAADAPVLFLDTLPPTGAELLQYRDPNQRDQPAPPADGAASP